MGHWLRSGQVEEMLISSLLPGFTLLLGFFLAVDGASANLRASAWLIYHPSFWVIGVPISLVLGLFIDNLHHILLDWIYLRRSKVDAKLVIRAVAADLTLRKYLRLTYYYTGEFLANLTFALLPWVIWGTDALQKYANIEVPLWGTWLAYALAACLLLYGWYRSMQFWEESQHMLAKELDCG